MRVINVPDGTRGFDTNRVVTYNIARDAMAKKYRFVARYVPRVTASNNDLSKNEVDAILRAGLGVMAVQHVESESSWTPSIDKGKSYGDVAVRHTLSCGIKLGTSVWLDLEGVNQNVAPNVIISYCNAWWDHVSEAGFSAGIYVGWHCGLTPKQLHDELKFEHYWGAYNLNRDQEPIIRGLQMKQGVASLADIPRDLVSIDTDIVIADKTGGLPFAYVPDEWDV